MKPIRITGEPQRENALARVRDLPLSPTFEVIIRPWKKDKTAAQIRTAHGWFREVRDGLQEAGHMYTFANVKHYFKDMFGLTIEHSTPAGLKVELKSLADYKIGEMAEFMDKCYHHAVGDLKIFVTLPGFEED
ncbi:hypothetical protein KAR91_09310 [Candidatus Pacearchaeota archaeon]|nr:hypothetical protein [Candidatus Pacearchaeota archaeon]